MNDKVSLLLAFGLLACSMRASAEPPVAASATARGVAPPIVIRSLPIEKPLIAKSSKGLPPARVCQLGNDCLTMDSHAFELCQVSGTSCGDKLADVLQVQQPTIILKPSPAQRNSR